jgi:Toprim domain/CHC2 zinc finger
VVQGTARDLLAAALIRFEQRGWSVVFHNHDEVTVEIPKDSISEQDVLALLLEPPAWAAGLPLGGKVRSGATYLEAPATAEPPQPESEEEIVEAAVDAFVADMPELIDADGTPVDPKYIEKNAENDFLASLGETIAPLFELVTLPMSSNNTVCCPFHEEVEPSCKIYADHFHCYGCGMHGDRLAWLTKVEGMTKAEIMATLYDGAMAHVESATTKQSAEEKYAYMMRLWIEARPLIGSPAERYLRDTRGIDTSRLPASIHEALRFHPHCPFGANSRVPCLIALMRDPLSDAPVGIHRTALTRDAAGRIDRTDRRMFGKAGVVKLWPADTRLIVGEGLESVLSAATRMTYRGQWLTPAWAALSSDMLSKLPPVPGVEELIIVVDNDINNEGQDAAHFALKCWRDHGRNVIPLVPKIAGTDANDVLRRVQHA